jgi:hypothetical protein
MSLTSRLPQMSRVATSVRSGRCRRPTPMRRALVAGALAVAAAVGTLAVTASPAAASDGSTIILTPKINPFLTVQTPVQSGAYAHVELGTVSSYLIDVWWFKPTGPEHTYELINDNSHQCMTSDDVAGDAVFQYPCVGSANQLWVSNIVAGETTARSYHALSSGLYLDVPHGLAAYGVSLDVWYWNGNDNQFFYSRQFH